MPDTHKTQYRHLMIIKVPCNSKIKHLNEGLLIIWFAQAQLILSFTYLTN